MLFICRVSLLKFMFSFLEMLHHDAAVTGWASVYY